MPPVPSEPEKYSIDEMMNRLTATPSDDPGDGELVTRSDGSQAIRVRKRKRRSSQPQKERKVRDRRVRIVQVSTSLILLFLVVLMAGAAIIYANSKGFQENLVHMIGQASGAKPDLQTFRMNPKTANSGNLTLTWPAGNALESLKLRGISAIISPGSFFGKSFTGEEITTAEGSLTLHLPSLGEPKRSIAAKEGMLPIRFNRYRTPIFNLTLNGQDSPILKLTGSEAWFSQETVAGNPQLSLYQGDFLIPGWPKLRLDRALIEFSGNKSEIVGMRLLHESDDSGTLALAGTVTPYQPDRLTNLAVSLNAFQLSGLLGPSFGNLISGHVDSVSSAKPNALSFKPVGDISPVMKVAFSVSPLSSIEIRQFPFLLTLSQMLDEDDWFEKPIFNSDATGVIHRENGTVSLRDLHLESKGRLTVRGNLSLTAQQALSGNLRIGLPEAMIPKSSSLEHMLSPAEAGFRWISLKISGTAATPADNFNQLRTESSPPPEAAVDPEPEGPSTFEELTRPSR